MKWLCVVLAAVAGLSVQAVEAEDEAPAFPDAGAAKVETGKKAKKGPTAASAPQDAGPTDAQKSKVEAKRFTGVVDVKSAAEEKPAKPPLDISKMSFTKESIAKVVTYHQDDVQFCYEQTLADKEKPVEGMINTRFVITGEGTVKQAQVLKKETTLKEPKLHQCVVKVLNGMMFPKPPTGKSQPIEYPFNLKAIH